MRKSIVSLLFILASTSVGLAQEYLPLWEKGKMPNSKGVAVADSIANERVYQVAMPGLYVFEPSKAENKGVAVVIIPGGGYARFAYQVSGFSLAKWFNTFGVTAFVLTHRLPQSPDVEVCYKAPVQDAQRALRYIRANAQRFGVNPDKVGVMGSSAGAHLAGCMATFTEDWSSIGDALDQYSFRPNFAIMVSPVVSMGDIAHKGSRQNLLGKFDSPELRKRFSLDQQVTAETAPCFVVHAMNDPAVSCLNSLYFFEALKKNKVAKCSLHLYPEGEHSIAVRNNPGTTNGWTAIAEQWLREVCDF